MTTLDFDFLYISKLFCLPDHKFTGFMTSRDFMVTQSFIVRDKPTTCTFPSIDFRYNKASKTTDDRNYVIVFGCYFQSNTHCDSTQLTIKIFVMDCYCHWSLKAQLSTLLKKKQGIQTVITWLSKNSKVCSLLKLLPQTQCLVVWLVCTALLLPFLGPLFHISSHHTNVLVCGGTKLATKNF